MGRLDGKVAIVTGGGGGIGRGISMAFLKEGAKVVVTDLNDEILAGALEYFNAENPNFDVLAVACDGAVREQVKNVVAKTVEKFGGVDIIVNSAHASRQVLLEDTTDEDIALSMGSGFFATFYYMQECFPYLKASGHGKIINFGSGAALKGQQTQGAYAAAKGAIRNVSRVACNEWGQYGICTNVICPFAETPGVIKWKEHFPEDYQRSINSIPLRRIGDPEMDIGRVVVFLASDDSNYVSGETIDVSGGGSVRP